MIRLTDNQDRVKQLVYMIHAVLQCISAVINHFHNLLLRLNSMVTDVQLAIFANMLGVSLFLLVVLYHYVAVNNPKKLEWLTSENKPEGNYYKLVLILCAEPSVLQDSVMDESEILELFWSFYYLIYLWFLFDPNTLHRCILYEHSANLRVCIFTHLLLFFSSPL